ncbi:Flp pilus assembly protein, ATPase CpaF [Desulfosporosinus acidiphilus SJ4]|uniref:Flp pilus assembly protein, ATPase CpaF n=1 Tax=Desulfosporosinus acidiphilus (strain DSM 22704 / JCM 16185 / SJ4) TaxID=646529 RepID=I4DAY3_DESAJ|nr:ATPase, T2SS/T4P/T4SS family [Desulfosporosinus acidiphilus]AFM42957.1 Flp pilus assembly protein, ATPase CpaF [Desulfosporosinus acidiphilus SJ4]
MPRFDLNTMSTTETGTVNMSDMHALSARKAETKEKPDKKEKSLFETIQEEVEAELLKKHGSLLLNKEVNEAAILREIQIILDKKSLTREEKDKVLTQMKERLFGFGIIEKYMRDSQITEIIIDSPWAIDVEIGGKLYRVGEEAPVENDPTFRDDDDLQNWTDQLMRRAKIERKLDQSNPFVNVELSQGERVEATCPPITEHITVNIRKSVIQTKKYTPDDYIVAGSADRALAQFLLAAARGKATMLILGATGTGKTTVARMLMEYGFDPEERTLMIEDTRETNANLKRFLSLQTFTQGQKKIDMVKLFEECMRKRPDRVCVSEIRGIEAAVFLMTGAAGHDGPITTMHASTPGKAVFLLIMRMRQAGYNMSEEFLERFIHEEVHIMVFIKRLRDGRRRISRVVEVNSLDNPDVPKFKDIFRWDKNTDTYQWVDDIEPERRETWSLEGDEVPVFPGKTGLIHELTGTGEMSKKCLLG